MTLADGSVVKDFEKGNLLGTARTLDTANYRTHTIGATICMPMYRKGENNDLSLEQPLEIHVWRGNGHYELYEDDGETRGYEQGNYAVTSFEVQSSGERVRFVISPPADSHGLLPESRQMSIHFRDVAAAQVYVNGEAAQNLPREELKTMLLTRVQGSNSWENTHFENELYY